MTEMVGTDHEAYEHEMEHLEVAALPLDQVEQMS